MSSSDLNLAHFEALRSKINARLTSIGTKHAYRQIAGFPWLYGALGQVPSEAMFICENGATDIAVREAIVRDISAGLGK